MTTQPKALARRDDQSIGQLLASRRTQLQSLLPASITPERFLRVAMNSISRTPGLAECSPQSILACILSAASVGLELDNGLGHAYMVPFGRQATLVIGYKGLVQLMYRSGKVLSIQARAVHQGDYFEWEQGLVERLSHRATAPEGAPLTHVYAIVRIKGGDPEHPLFEVMTKAQVDAIRARSRAGNSGPWVTDYDQMACKTGLRRIAKLAPMSAQEVRIVGADELADAGLDQMDAFDPDLLLEAKSEPSASAPGEA